VGLGESGGGGDVNGGEGCHPPCVEVVVGCVGRGGVGRWWCDKAVVVSGWVGELVVGCVGGCLGCIYRHVLVFMVFL